MSHPMKDVLRCVPNYTRQKQILRKTLMLATHMKNGRFLLLSSLDPDDVASSISRMQLSLTCQAKGIAAAGLVSTPQANDQGGDARTCWPKVMLSSLSISIAHQTNFSCGCEPGLSAKGPCAAQVVTFGSSRGKK